MEKMKRLFVIATGNPGKVRDFSAILGTESNDFKTLGEIGFDRDIIENGKSFAENAQIKSSVTAKWLFEKGVEASVLADDSGLEVFSLGGEPGIFSARYAGGHGDDAANNRKLLSKLHGKADRAARYFCALSYQTVFRNSSGNLEISNPMIFEGECRGRIGFTPVGEKGFGYDPLFIPDGENRTFAEMELSEKKLISHRGAAIRALHEALQKICSETENS